jgi:hypothetical protein
MVGLFYEVRQHRRMPSPEDVAEVEAGVAAAATPH